MTFFYHFLFQHLSQKDPRDVRVEFNKKLDRKKLKALEQSGALKNLVKTNQEEKKREKHKKKSKNQHDISVSSFFPLKG